MGNEQVKGVDDRQFLSHAPTAIFILVLFYHIGDRFFDHLKKREPRREKVKQLREEIKEIRKEASLLSTPSSFAHAAKLQRTAAAKQKELAKIQQENNGKNAAFDFLAKAFLILKMISYLGFSWWFWNVPIAEVPQQFLQPLGRMLSWKAGNSTSDAMKVGIIPWLFLSTRVSKFLSQKLTGASPHGMSVSRF